MSDTLRVLTVVVVALLALAGCDEDRRAISRDDLPDVPEEPTFTVELSDNGFEPEELSVTTLDLIEFQISDGTHGIRTEDHSIDTGPLFDEETTLIMLTEPGEVELFDTEDDGRSMTVTVTDADG